MPRVIHFELPVDDAKRASEFYANVFDWKVQGWEGEEGYWLVATGSNEPGIDGAFISRSFASQLVKSSVSSRWTTTSSAPRAGAKILRDKQEIPTVGFAGYIQAPEGNTVGLFESSDGVSS